MDVDIFWVETYCGIPIHYEMFRDNETKILVLAANGAVIRDRVRWSELAHEMRRALLGFLGATCAL